MNYRGNHCRRQGPISGNKEKRLELLEPGIVEERSSSAGPGPLKCFRA